MGYGLALLVFAGVGYIIHAYFVDVAVKQAWEDAARICERQRDAYRQDCICADSQSIQLEHNAYQLCADRIREAAEDYQQLGSA